MIKALGASPGAFYIIMCIAAYRPGNHPCYHMLSGRVRGDYRLCPIMSSLPTTSLMLSVTSREASPRLKLRASDACPRLKPGVNHNTMSPTGMDAGKTRSEMQGEVDDVSPTWRKAGAVKAERAFRLESSFYLEKIFQD